MKKSNFFRKIKPLSYSEHWYVLLLDECDKKRAHFATICCDNYI